jgi:hypothetical protein
MDDLENLEFLSLVSKVTSEIQNHLGVSDKPSLLSTNMLARRA